MNKLKSFSKRLLKNNSGQGMVEYILMLVVVVAIVMIMKNRMTGYTEGMLDNMKGQIDNVMGN